MIEVWFYSLVSVFIVSLISLVGIFTLSIKSDKLNKILIYFVSFSAGALLADAFIHLLPEIVRESGFSLTVSLSLIAGILLFFVLEKFIKWRHCHDPECEDHIHSFAYMNIFGDVVHNFIDGLIIAASYLVSIPVGIATTLAVIFHEIPQEIGEFGLLLYGGFSKAKALLVNFLSALTAVLGAVVGLWLAGMIPNVQEIIVPIAAGGFIYIAGSDLIPEMHKETKISKSLIQILALLLGIMVMIALLALG
ncbi:MAG: ZIP family metal transporter [Nanoarchaeota archaeon]|nr:ZIP family metal transporter [Nanoarchaeota archaeon]MBU4086024.1 ZIP family metal transporter [Nanoarchaeota archaeon]